MHREGTVLTKAILGKRHYLWLNWPSLCYVYTSNALGQVHFLYLWSLSMCAGKGVHMHCNCINVFHIVSKLSVKLPAAL